MKVLKSEQEYIYGDFRELQCGVCKKKLWDKGQEIIKNTSIRCPQCGTTYSFEPTRWRALADVPKPEE
jgi:NAD-dependent SIR2 family protein deacetylase